MTGLDLTTLTTEEKARLFRELSQAPAILEQQRAQEQEQAERDLRESTADLMESDLTQQLEEFVTKRRGVAQELNTWIQQGLNLARSLEKLNGEARTLLYIFEQWSVAMVIAGRRSVPPLDRESQISGLIQDELRQRTGNAYLMTFPQPAITEAQYLAGLMSKHCEAWHGTRFNLSSAGDPLQDVPTGAIETITLIAE